MAQPGTYVLVLLVTREAQISIGRLGSFNFPPGYHLYAGSARGPGGLKARLTRHLSGRKQVRWHVDYLLREAKVVEVWTAPSPDKLECLWAQALLRMPGARISVSGFGSSDCGCPTHLVYFSSPPSFHAFVQRLQASGAGAPLHRQVADERTPNQGSDSAPVRRT